MPKSIRSAVPRKPHPDFPLFPHRSNRWCKKLKGKFHYFGKVSEDPTGEKALARWLAEKDYLLAGKEPKRPTVGGLTVVEMVNRFLTAKTDSLQAGEIGQRRFGELHASGKRLTEFFGSSAIVEDLTPEDFGRFRAKLQETRGPVAMLNEITTVRSFFRFALTNKLILTPADFGESFNKPKKVTLTKAAAKAGDKDIKADELRLLLDALQGREVTVEGKSVAFPADPVLFAVTLLAINAAYGAHDIAELPRSALDLTGGWVTFPRPKTGMRRRAKLWPETIEACKVAMDLRPAPKSPDDAHLAFLTPNGRRWVRASQSEDPTHWKARADMLGKRFSGWLKRLGIGGGRGIYGLRHAFQSAADEAIDDIATKYIMGHSDPSMSARYRGGRISDARLEAVASVVRRWLFGK